MNRIALAMIIIGGILLSHPVVAQPARMEIALAGTEIIRTEQPVNMVAVGDPSVAEVSLINERAILITGKRIGTTGFVLLDRSGTEILRRVLRVGAEQKPVRIFDGTPTGMAFVCAPLCTPAQGQENLLARNVNRDGTAGAPAEQPPAAGQTSQ